MTHSSGGDSPATLAEAGPRTTITVLTTQLHALKSALGGALGDDDCYSAAAIAVLLYLPGDEVERALDLASVAAKQSP